MIKPAHIPRSDLPSAISVFLAVGHYASFTKAARMLGMSISGVSRAVSRLEQRLGVALVNRTTRQVSLTTEGSLYFERCQQLFSQLEEIEVAINRGAAEIAGRVRIMLTPGFGRQVIVPALADFAVRHPSVTLDVLIDSAPIDLVEEGIDLAIQVEKTADSRLVARKLCDLVFVLCGSPAYLARAGTPRTVDDLRDHVALTFMHPRSARARMWELGPRNTLSRIGLRSVMRINDLQSLRDAAMTGAGLAYLPDFIVAEAVRDGHLKVVLPDSTDRAPIHIMYPAQRIRLPRVRALATFLSKWVQEHRP